MSVSELMRNDSFLHSSADTLIYLNSTKIPLFVCAVEYTVYSRLLNMKGQLFFLLLLQWD